MSRRPAVVIKNYGLFWHRDAVYFGEGANAGALLGKARIRNKDVIVDFREQVGIYILYNDYKIVYIGQSGNSSKNFLFKRLRSHRKHLSDRWNKFSWFGLCEIDLIKTRNFQHTHRKKELPIHQLKKFQPIKVRSARHLLNQLEGVLIECIEETLNKQGGSLGQATKFKQVKHNRLPPSQEEMIDEIYERVIKANKK